MNLSGQQRKGLQDALVSAFPTRVSLEQMMSFELDKNLAAIAGGDNLQEIVFRLIQAAQAEGWVEDLVRAACKVNPRNSQLMILAQVLYREKSSNEKAKVSKFEQFDNEVKKVIFKDYPKCSNDEFFKNSYIALRISGLKFGLSEEEIEDRIKNIFQLLNNLKRELEDHIKECSNHLNEMLSSNTYKSKSSFEKRVETLGNALEPSEETVYNGRKLGNELISLVCIKIGNNEIALCKEIENDEIAKKHLKNAQFIFEIVKRLDSENPLVYEGCASIFFIKEEYTKTLAELIKAKELLKYNKKLYENDKEQYEEKLNSINERINDVPITNHVLYAFIRFLQLLSFKKLT